MTTTDKLREQWREQVKGCCKIMSKNCRCHLCLLDDIDRKLNTAKEIITEALVQQRLINGLPQSIQTRMQEYLMEKNDGK